MIDWGIEGNKHDKVINYMEKLIKINTIKEVKDDKEPLMKFNKNQYFAALILNLLNLNFI